MTSIRATWTSLIRLRSDRSGQVAYLFALLVVPMLCASGAALDYSRARALQVRLDAALDAAVLSVASRKSNSFDEAEVKRVLSRQFRAYVDALPKGTRLAPGDVGFDAQVLATAKGPEIRASYTALVDTTLTRLMKFDAMQLSGSAAASRNYAAYIDFHLLLDNSPSMGLAATDAEIQRLIALTASQPADHRRSCAFACHEKVMAGGVAVGDDLSDNYYVAKRNNVKLRIDNLREATQQLVDTAKKDEKLDNQYRMAIYTFSDVFQKLAPLSDNLDQVKIDAGNIALAYTAASFSQTSYIRALPKIAAEIPDGGDGRTAASANRFLFFVTDGMQDAPTDGKLLGKYDMAVDAQRFIGAIDPKLCQSIKARGIRIGVIYTKYLPLPMNDFYNKYSAPFEKAVPDNLQACASDDLFFTVSTNEDIGVAMKALFKKSVSAVRLVD